MQVRRNSLDGSYLRVPGKGLIPNNAYRLRSPGSTLPRATLTISGVDLTMGCCAVSPFTKVWSESLGTNRAYCLEVSENAAGLAEPWVHRPAPGVDTVVFGCSPGSLTAAIDARVELGFQNGEWIARRSVDLGGVVYLLFFGRVVEDGTYPVVIPNLISTCVPYANPFPGTGVVGDFGFGVASGIPMGTLGNATVEFLTCGGAYTPGAKAHVFPNLPQSYRTCCDVIDVRLEGGTAVDGFYRMTKVFGEATPDGWGSPSTASAKYASLGKVGTDWRLSIIQFQNRSATFAADSTNVTSYSQPAGPCPTATGWTLIANENGGAPALTVTLRNCWDGL